jgi:hypothetical protein
VFTLSGRMNSESVAELERLFKSEADGCHMVTDRKIRGRKTGDMNNQPEVVYLGR